MEAPKRFFQALIVFLVLFIFSGSSLATVIVFVKEYTYQASEADSKLTSRAMALEQAKRLVLEELGTYLMSNTEVKDFQVTSDKIVVLTAGIVQTEISDEKWNGEIYYLKAYIKADPDDVAKAIDNLRKDETKTKELEDVKKRADDALKEIESLKSQLEAVKNDKAKQLEYANKVNSLSATDWYKKGLAFGNSKEYDNARDACSKAIELDPDYPAAYLCRGYMYQMKGHYDRTIADYNKAISLKPKTPLVFLAYYNRGLAYGKEGQYDTAIEDYNKAISLQPNDTLASRVYNSRGNAKRMKRQNDLAIDDFNKAISLKSDYAEAYYNRGLAYYMKRQYDMAKANYQKACELGFRDGCKLVAK